MELCTSIENGPLFSRLKFSNQQYLDISRLGIHSIRIFEGDLQLFVEVCDNSDGVIAEFVANPNLVDLIKGMMPRLIRSGVCVPIEEISRA